MFANNFRISDETVSPRSRARGGLTFTWHDIVCSVNGRQVLHSVNGSLAPGGLTAIIGPSRSGKSTLLSILCNKPDPLYKLKGELRVNNVPFSAKQHGNLYRQIISFLGAGGEALLSLESSPREIISFHVALLLPTTDADSHTSYILNALHLKNCADVPVRSISSGERTRTLIGIELVKTPAALVLDDPVSGLDVYEGFLVMQVLKSLALARGVTVLVTMSRPSSEVFFSLDRVIMLSRGSTVFVGTPCGLKEYFCSVGYEIPEEHSPMDYVILLLQAISQAEHRRLVDNWRWKFGNAAEGFTGASDDLGFRVSSSGGDMSPLTAKSMMISEKRKRPNAWLQFKLLLKRESTESIRSPGIFFVRLGTTTLISLLVGCFFWKLGNRNILENSKDLENYYAAMGFVLLTALFGQVEAVATTIPLTRSRFLLEYSADLYSSIIFFACQIMIEIFTVFINCIVHLLVSYFMIGLRGSFVYWLFCLFAVTVATTSVGWWISCNSGNAVTAMQLLPIAFLPQILFCGMIVDLETVPQAVRWLQYFSYLKYCFNLVYITEFSDYKTDELVMQVAKRNTIDFTKMKFYGGVVIAFIVGVRIFAAISLARQASNQSVRSKAER